MGAEQLTLVVAKKVKNAIIVVSDTKLTDDAQTRWSSSDQCNKVVCISDEWAVAFAGSTYFADRLFKSLPAGADYRTLTDAILEVHRVSLSHVATDFILISVLGAKIFIFKDGECSRTSSSTAWIGDINAYSRYQVGFHRMREHREKPGEKISFSPGSRVLRPQIMNDEIDRLATCSSSAMYDVIKNTDIQNVGGVPLILVIALGRQQVWPAISGIFTSPNPILEGSPDRDVFYGEAQTGDFNFEVVPMERASSNSLAVFYPNANVAVLFARWEGGIPYGRVFRDVRSELLISLLGEHWDRAAWRIQVEKKFSTYEINADGPLYSLPLMGR